jgi:Mrp family chromosome partitioning ATPase
VTDSAVIVHLVGFPGAGKYTVAQAIARQAERDGRRFVVIDNHLTSNVIFSVMDVDGVRPLPPEVWDRVGEVRAALCGAIEEFSPPDCRSCSPTC